MTEPLEHLKWCVIDRDVAAFTDWQGNVIAHVYASFATEEAARMAAIQMNHEPDRSAVRVVERVVKA